MVRYLIRFDDLCPTMDHAKWARAEAVVRKHGVKPIISVIPDNRDPTLVFDQEDPQFWQKMRALQDCHWTIGLHGFQHTFICRGKSVVPIQRQSEFVGLPEEEQRKKIESGLSLLRGRGLEPEVWVAPGHSFDDVTLAVLKEVGIDSVSDGFAFYPYSENEIFWIPQQMWRFRRMPFGVWSICLHHNHMGDAEMERMDTFIGANKHSFSNLPELKRIFSNRPRSLVDLLFREYCHLAFKNAVGNRAS